MKKKPSSYKEIHGQRTQFARSIGTRSSLQATGLHACSDKALAYAIAAGAGSDRAAAAKQKVVQQLAAAKQHYDQDLVVKEQAALSGSLLLSMAGTGAMHAVRRESFHSVQSRDSLEMTDDSLSDREPDIERGSQHVNFGGALKRQSDCRSDDAGPQTPFQAHQDAVQQILNGPGAAVPHRKTAALQDPSDRSFLLPEPPLSPVAGASFSCTVQASEAVSFDQGSQNKRNSASSWQISSRDDHGTRTRMALDRFSQ